MATVRSLEKSSLELNSRHTETNCTYSIVTDQLGERFLQIDTYGSRDRKIAGKKSQSIRFSVQALEQLKAILRELEE